MARTKLSPKQTPVKTGETSLAKRVLDSNLGDEDKITIIQMIGNPQSVISIPSIWPYEPKTIDVMYRDQNTGSPKPPNEFIVTCTAENNSCPHADCLNAGE